MSANRPLTTDHSIIQFNDGATALAYNKPGDTVVLGIDSNQKWARGFDPAGGRAVLIQTESGNSYAIADGVVVNMKTGRARPFGLGEELVVQVGKPLTIAGIGTTTPVKGVYLQYKTLERNSRSVDRQVDMPNPFPTIRQRVAPLAESIGFSR